VNIGDDVHGSGHHATILAPVAAITNSGCASMLPTDPRAAARIRVLRSRDCHLEDIKRQQDE
jgi:hypothetical protein